MGDSLRDQLLKAGFAPARPDKPRDNKPRDAGARRHESGVRSEKKHVPKPARNEDFDLARAYAIRAQAEKSERDAAAREAERQAQERRERKRRLQELLAGNALQVPADAEHVRHFEHAGKIRRIHVDAAQLARLNAGQAGVVVQAGRFILVERAIAEQVRAIAPEAVVLLVDPGAAPDPADDGVPDDLMW